MRIYFLLLLSLIFSVSYGQIVLPTITKSSGGYNPNGGSPGGSAGGDLSGTYPNPSVVKIQNVSVSGTNATAVSNLTGINTGDQNLSSVLGNGRNVDATGTIRDISSKNSIDFNNRRMYLSNGASLVLDWEIKKLVENWEVDGSLTINEQLGIGSTPVTSAILDASSTTQGILVPRMTTAQKNAIVSPATSLMVYDTDLGYFYFYDGVTWIAITKNTNQFTHNGNSFGANAILGTNDNFDLLFETNATEKMRITSSGNLGINVSSPDSRLDIASNTTTGLELISTPIELAATTHKGGFFNLTRAGGTSNATFRGIDNEVLSVSNNAAATYVGLKSRIAVSEVGSTYTIPSARALVGELSITNSTSGLVTCTQATALDLSSIAASLTRVNIATYTGILLPTSFLGLGVTTPISLQSGSTATMRHFGNVSIGTTSAPTRAISLTGDMEASGLILHSDGSSSAPSITNTGDENTGIYFPGTDQVGITAGGTQYARFGSSGTTPYEPILFTSSISSAVDENLTAMRFNLTTNQQTGFLTICRGLDIDIANTSSGGTIASYGIDYDYAISDVISSQRVGFRIGTTISTPQSDWRGMNIFDPTGAGSLTTAYGLKIEAITFGTTNWGLAVGDVNNYMSGKLRIGSTATPTAKLHLAAGTTAASTAPLKFTSGSLMTSAEAGAIEFLTDDWYATITTGTARHKIVRALTGSATLNFANQAAIGCNDLTVTVTGAADGDDVCVSPPNGSVPNETATFTAWVSAANTVTVRYCQLVSGDPASGTFKVTVIKN